MAKGIPDPRRIVIRPAAETDAERLLSLHLALDEETDFMLLEPGERSTDVEAERERLRRVAERSDRVVLVADDGERLVGYVAVVGLTARRNRHCAWLVTGVRQTFAGRGIGRRLLEAAERWATGAGLHRLELTVMAHNARAIRLYERMGFAREGRRVHALRIGGAWVDEYYMGKTLPEGPGPPEGAG